MRPRSSSSLFEFVEPDDEDEGGAAKLGEIMLAAACMRPPPEPKNGR